MKIYDCFMYFDEEVVLDLRLNTLNEFVDYFVIVESKFTHKGDKRELKLSFHFLENKSLGSVIKYLCEEPVLTELDNSGGELIQLLKSLQKEFELTYLFITHDLRIVRHIADKVFVMKDGELMEQGKTDIIFNNPKTAYTKELLASIPGNRKLKRNK